MPRYIAVDRVAAEDIISDRFLQSVDFEPGQTLAYVLGGRIGSAPISSRIRIEQHEDGLFFLPAAALSSDYFVVDVEAAPSILAQPSDSEALLVFQKLLRFATRYWKNLKLSAAERVIVGTTRAAIFPFPISQKTSFRVMVDLSPDSKRQTRRAKGERHLLAYKGGTDERPDEEISPATFRKFLATLETLRRKTKETTVAVGRPIRAMTVTELAEIPIAGFDFAIGYSQWRKFLTNRQLAFVDSPLEAPHRIEGPAGSGKTLCLVLKCIATLETAKSKQLEHRSLFIAHSEATRRAIEDIIKTNDPGDFLGTQDLTKRCSIELSTLHQLCGKLLKREISESEFLDRDAMESKELQLLYIADALSEALKDDFATHQKFLSPDFSTFLCQNDPWTIAQLLQHEISVVIKGRAQENLDAYRKLPRIRYGLPVITSSDRGFAFLIFRRYQAKLESAAQFDTDDIVLTAIGQLDTPIWRRRRDREAYDSIFIDETHLFNINELSLFHFLTRRINEHPIAYSVDRSQAVGDRGWTDELFEETLVPDAVSRPLTQRTEFKGIFRCAPEIVDLAFSVTSGGATLFTNFDDPLKIAASMFTEAEERRCAVPTYYSSANDDQMIADSFGVAERMVKEMGTSKSAIAIIAFSDELFKKAQHYAISHNKPVEVIKERGDTAALQRAKISGRFVLAAPDYVGGLEFDGVVLVGVDEGRVPPARTQETIDSSNFLAYASHNRLYVAITRARYRVCVMTTKERGPSKLLHHAIKHDLLVAA